MKRFLSTVAFCILLLFCGFIFILPSAQAEKNLLQNLLNLPAPPPPNSLVVKDRKIFPPEFFSKNKPPEDDAPLEELLAYWQNQSNSYRELGYNIKPSKKSLQRIASEIEANPEKLPDFLNALPENTETADFVKRIYDGQISREDSDESWSESVKKWLTFHSKYFSDELLAVARKVGDTDEYVTNQDELLALTRVDWDKARPILERLYNGNRQPVSQTLARWAFYRHALDEDSASDIEKYRDELKATVENKSATAGMRDLAIDALVKEKEWQGLDDWYSTLLADETLADLRVNGRSYTGLTTIMYYSPPEKRLEKMLQLVKSSNPAVRDAAVRNLVFLLDDKNPEVVRALLPWLENPQWAKETSGERRRLISALANTEMPESVPGLIAVLNEKENQQTIASTTGSTAANVNRPVIETAVTNSYSYRSEAISALAKQKDARAIAPLRELLAQVEGWQAGNIVRALLACGGFSIPEQVEALESAAKSVKEVDKEIQTDSLTNSAVGRSELPMPPVPPMPGRAMLIGNMTPMSRHYSIVARSSNPSDVKAILGTQLVNQPEADGNLVAALIERINVLDEKDPPTAFGLRKIMQNWRGAAINALMLRDLKTNRTNADAIVKLLGLRKNLRENQFNEVSDVRGGSSTALGIAACLLENTNEYDALLNGENVEAKTAMLACARLIRAALPVRKVAENLRNPNKLLALAAERYLEAEDSPEAQAFVLALHPNEAKILGARRLFIPDDAPFTNSPFLPTLFSSLDELSFFNVYYLFTVSGDRLAAGEKILQKEVKINRELLGVYAYDDNFIRIYKDKAVFSWQTDQARYHERSLSKEEFDGFKDFLTAEKVGEMPQYISDCRECNEKELLMLGRDGGRRIFLLGENPPRFFVELEKMLAEMREPPAKLRYVLEKEVAGLEILFTDQNLQAEAVWKNGADFRVLISDAARREQIDRELERQDGADEEREESSEEISVTDRETVWKKQQTRRSLREFENFAWYQLAENKLAGLTDQPLQSEFIPKFDGAAVRAAAGQWKARAAAFEIRSDDEGLYKISNGKTIKIRAGNYGESVVTTPNGRWAITTKYLEEEGSRLVRVNLTTKKEIPVATEDYIHFQAVAFVSTVNKVLIFGGGYDEEETEDTTQRRGEYFFLDAETGAISKPKGEVRPLAQQTFRPLQPTGKPDEFWAAIPDAAKDETNVGVYNAKTLAFKSILKLPQIKFNSMQMWFDAGKVYFVYENHLLSLPLPKDNPPVTN